MPALALNFLWRIYLTNYLSIHPSIYPSFTFLKWFYHLGILWLCIDNVREHSLDCMLLVSGWKVCGRAVREVQKAALLLGRGK